MIESKELLEKLSLKMYMCNSNKYEEFYYEEEEAISNLSIDHKFELLKEMYVGVKVHGTNFIGEKLNEHIEMFGVPVKEFKNIEKIFREKTIKVYRGINSYNFKNGSSYTLDRNRAEWFANLSKENGYVIEREVKIDDIIFYCNDREEQEVFLKREALDDLEGLRI